MASPQPIDLSAGFVPLPQAQAQPQTPAQQQPIDLSAGFVPLSSVPATGSISAKKQPTTIPQKVEGWAGDVSNDLKYGTGTTGVGWLLKKLGAPGLYSGTSEGTGDFMGSAPLGALRTIKGMAQQQQPGKTLQGTGNVLAGAAQAATIPSAFVAPEAGEAAAAIPGKVAGLLPSTERAGANFNAVKAAVGSHPVEVTDQLSNSLMRYQQLVDSGGSRSLSVNKLLQRLTSPENPPLTYGEARDFYSNISRLSADEMQRLTPVMRRAVGDIANSFGDAIEQTAQRGGKLDQFQNAMQEYRNAMRVKSGVQAAKDAAVGAVKYGVGPGIVGYLAKKGISAATQSK